MQQKNRCSDEVPIITASRSNYVSVADVNSEVRRDGSVGSFEWLFDVIVSVKAQVRDICLYNQQFRNIGKDAKMEDGFTRVKQRFDGNGTSNIGGPGEDGRGTRGC